MRRAVRLVVGHAGERVGDRATDGAITGAELEHQLAAAAEPDPDLEQRVPRRDGTQRERGERLGEEQVRLEQRAAAPRGVEHEQSAVRQREQVDGAAGDEQRDARTPVRHPHGRARAELLVRFEERHERGVDRSTDPASAHVAECTGCEREGWGRAWRVLRAGNIPGTPDADRR
jgi:hypothetical protein